MPRHQGGERRLVAAGHEPLQQRPLAQPRDGPAVEQAVQLVQDRALHESSRRSAPRCSTVRLPLNLRPAGFQSHFPGFSSRVAGTSNLARVAWLVLVSLGTLFGHLDHRSWHVPAAGLDLPPVGQARIRRRSVRGSKIDCDAISATYRGRLGRSLFPAGDAARRRDNRRAIRSPLPEPGDGVHPRRPSQNSRSTRLTPGPPPSWRRCAGPATPA